jgi:formylglycine-generating enzyme required for sulfatase activity
MKLVAGGMALIACLVLFLLRDRLADELRRPGAEKVIHLGNGVTLELIWIPPGEFIMGSPRGERSRERDEIQHAVKLTKGFWLGKYEVTQGQWARVMTNNPSCFQNAGPRAPVEQVSWYDCQQFLAELNRIAQTGGLKPAVKGKFRLPTEAEWEFACRAGTTNRFSYGDEDNDLWQYCNYCDKSNTDRWKWQDTAHDDGYDKVAPVGSFKPNPWGLYDMHGNVWEWCQDWAWAYPTNRVKNPKGPPSGTDRTLRGGSWFRNARHCRSADRRWNTPDYRKNTCGLRVVLTSR